ncbi:hypothetical protein D6D92_02505 [Moraxella catarrhalis]|uniref:putative barnase/colicin E5 family endoribonuclease n=1 Tax=Moraxella catarrhalis TaxID=480 RepID=UPI000EA8E7E7|nr:hypothetical protein [Moraxella catarrhalis]RKM01647.1 hypothetical protein D6E05_07790 [Moraxella catarrhalis]RKM06078.1 hypothetical protein D6D84_07490 [Moraxella catarrhalis]RKM08185.1 hypothetical protein D6D89_01275 [Moraxella catarrhalis]RKM13063.1 hypothetical protein D6D97_02075 [Moraxella catarrhalis]RKM15108.1 hypothetical protein D6D61_06750 [Moraxella catarrhalis]
MSTDLDKVLQKLQAAQSRNIAQVEQAQKRMGIETHSERQKRLTDEEAARLASENSFYKQAATNNTITPEIAPVYSPKVTARHNGGNILTDTGWGAASGVNSLIQGGLAVADTMLTQHVVNPVNNAYSMFTGDSKPLIPMPESEQKIAGRVVNAGIYQAALKKLGIYDAKAIEEYIAKKYSNEYSRQKAEVDEAVKDIENPLLKFAATFGHSLTKPNLLAAGAGSSLPQALPAGAIGRGAKVANAALSASTRAGIGTAVTSAVVEMGDTAKDKGYSTHRDMAYDLATGAGLGLVSKGLPSSFSTEQIIANGGVSRILANSANRARTTAVNTATETGQEAVQGALESALNQQQKEGKIDWGKVGKDAGMEAAVGFGMAGGPAIVGNIKAAVGDVKGFRSTLKTDPNNKNYDPNYAYQVSAGKAALGEIDIDSAKAEQTQALTTAMSRLTEFDEKLAQLPDGKKKEKLQKKRNDWFNNQVQPLQDTVAALEQVSNLQLSQEMSSDEVLQRILDLNAEAYHNRKQQAEQQLTDAVNYQPEIPEYTNVDGVGTSTTSTQQASTGVIAIGDSIANAFGNQYKKAGVTSYSKDGRNPNEVLNTITKLSKSELQGKTVVLSTGLSNNTKADLNTIRKQIKYLKDNGASVQVMGVANNFKDDSKLGTRMNTDLANIAKEMGVTFLGGFDYAKADKYKAHPDSGWYKPIYDKVGITQAQGQAVSGTSQYSTNFSIDNSNKSRDDLIMGTYTAFRKAGFTDGQARYLIGEVNRENGFSAKTMFGSHSDHANGANNFGFISWQQGRRTNLFKFLKDRGIDVKESGIPQTQASLDAMAAFFMQEMKSGGITLSQYRGGTYDTRNFLKQANPDLKDRRWGHAAIGWAYGQNKLKSGASFNSSTHEAKLDKGHADINRLLGSNYTGSFSSQSSNSNLNVDDNRTAQERLESLITKLKDEKTKTKEAEAQKALQDKISSLEAQVADNQTNSQQEQVSVESEAVSKAQQDTFDEIIRYSEMLSDDMINILVEQGALSEKHAEKLRLLKEVRVVENATKNTDDVKYDIYIGKKAKRAEDGYIGLQSYQQGLVQYLKTDDIGVLDSYYNHLSRFNESHTSKAIAAKQAMDSFDENQQPLYIARKADSQEWEVHEGSISKELRAKTGAIEISNISRNFVNNLIEEAFHLNQIKQGYDKAYELHGASDRIKESVKVSDFGLTDFSQINTGVSQQQQPVQVTRASNINQTPVADVTASDPTIEPTTTPTQESIPVTPPVTKTPSSVPTQRKPFRLPTNPYNDTLARDSSVGEYQRKIQEGVATPNYVWLGRGERQVNDEGKMATVSLSSIYHGTGSAKDPKTGQVTVRSNVFVDENKEVIKAGIFGSPIQSPIYVNSTNAHDQQKLKLIEEFGGDMYSIVHDGTQAGKDAAMIESANRYMDFMRVAVSNNQDFSRALLQMAADPNTGFVVQHKMSNSAFSEAAIVPRVVEELRKHPALQKISYKEQPQAVFNVLSNMGTLMADGQFHSEIQRPIDTNTFGKEDNLYKPHVFSKDDLNKFNEYTATNSTSNTSTGLNSGNAGNNTPPNITDNNGITETGIDENTNTDFDLSVFESHQNNTTEATKTLPTDVSTNTKENSTQEAESSADESVTPQETVAVKRNSSIPTNRASNAITKETVLKPMQVRKLESISKAKEENKAEDTVYITNTPIEKSFINKPVKVSDLASSIESSQIKTKDKSQAENQALISVLSKYSPDIKVKIQDKTSYDEKASYDDDIIRVSEDSKNITRDIAQAMVHKQIGNIADELDTLDHVTALANIEAKKQRDANRKEGKQNTDTLFDDEVIDRQAKLGELRLTIDSINKDVRKHMRKILSDPNQKFTENSKALLMRATDSAADLLQLGLFNEDVKSVLKQVKVSRGKNKITKAYHALMDAVTNFFGFSKDESTAYTKLLGIVSDSTSLSALDSEGNFSKSSEAKIRQLNEPAKNIEEDLTKPITATKDSKVVRNVLKTSFRQVQTLHKPLSSIQNFVRELYTNPIKASQILNLEPPTKAQREQINDFAEFTAEFREHLKQVFKPADEGYENRALANYFYDKQTGEFDSNVLDALSYGAYDYLNSVANHTMNMRDDILALLGLTSKDVEQKNNAYITKEMWETYKYIGSGYVKVADDLGKRIAETLNIQRTENGSITVDSRLYSALGTWALSAMQSADLIHLHSISSEKHKKAIEEVRGVIDEKDFNSHGTVRFVSITNKEGEGINKRINEISEANKGTAGYLTDIMGGVSAVRMPSLKPIEESIANVKRRIKRTDATVTDLQAQRVAKAQAHANVINEPTFSLLTNLASQHEDAFLEIIGAKLKEGELQTAHINDRDGLEGKAEAVMRDWTNAVDFINSIPKVDGVRKYWDTMFMAVNSRMHYNSNVFNYQSSKLHRAMAEPSNFKVTVQLKNKDGSSVLDSLQSKLKEYGKEIHSKHLTKDELNLTYFLRALAENMEGSEDFIEAYFKNTGSKEIFTEGFTVDKLPSYVFIPAFIEYLNQEHIQKATEIVSKAQAGDKISSEEMNHLSSVIDEMAMTGSSLRALREWADFQTAQENNHANFTTSLGLGSDGLNNGAALAHFWNGAFYKELLLRTGFFSFNDPFKSYFDARHDKNLGDYYTAFKNAVINEKAQEAFIMGFHANLEKDLANHNEQVFRALMKVQKSLTKRAVAKSVLIPFNYGAGISSLKKAVFRTFLKEMQDNITLAAQQDIANKKALEAGQMTQLEYDTQRAKLLNQVMTVDRLFSFMTQKPIQWDITIDNEPKAVVINENLDLKYMLEAWISPKDEAMLDNKYSFTMGQYLAEVLQDYEAVYIEKNKVNMRILSSTVELFTQMYHEVEERAIQTVAERISNALVETGLDRGLANELALKEISYRGLSDKEREELVHSVMDKVQAQIHNVYSVQNNESKAKVRLTRLAEILFVDKANLTNNSFFLVNKSGKYQATSFGSPARHIHLEDKALLANSVQTQSMDSYISSFAMAMGKKININVHDANIGAIDNQLDMITQQNRATFQALVSYHGQLESLRALTSVIQSSYALIKDGVIRKDFHDNEVFAELTQELSSLVDEVRDTELNKLDQLANLAYLHQYAGEFGEYQVTDADRQTALKEKNKVVDQINQLEKDLALNTTIKVMSYEPNKRTDTTKQQTSESGIVQLSDTRATEQVSQLPTTSTGTDGTQGAAFINSSSTPTEPTIQNLKQLDQTIKGLVNVSEVQLKLNKMLMGKANQHLSKMSVKFADVTTPNGTRAYGSYNVTTHTLTLDNLTFSQSGNDENKLRVINHELVHALTEYAIISNAQDLRSELNHLNKMLDAVMAQWQEDVAFNKKYGQSRHDTKEDDLTYVNQIMEVIKASQEADTTNGNHYAGLSEFIAYGMTDPEMMRYIDYAMELADLGIKPRKGISSVMDFLVRLASKVLGFKGDGYKAFVQNVETIMDNPPVDLLTLTSNDTRFSASAMKSVQANIKRGTEAMNKAITTKADVKRAMYRNDIGWIDFVWGSTGILKANGKTKGAMGISHIIEARMRKDGMSYDEVVEMLVTTTVETIAKGSVFARFEQGGATKLQLVLDNHLVNLVKNKGSNAWVITAFEMFEDGTGKGYGKTSPTHNQSYSARTDVGASNETNITQVTTDSNEDTRYSQIFDETDKQSASEVFNSLDSQTLTDGWNKHLQEVWDSLFDGNIAYSTLSEMEQKSLLDTAKQVNKVFVPHTFNMAVKEQLSYQAVTSIVDFLVNNHTDSNITSELNKIHAQLIKAYPTAADLYPDYHTANDEVKNLYDTEHSKLFKSVGEMNNLASVVALVLSSQTFNELTDQKVELRKTKHDSWFDKFMNLWHKAMNLLRTKYINANSTSEATKQLMAKLVNAETNARLARVSMIDKAWNTVYQKPMDAANWVWDKTWDIGSEAIISGLPMSSQMRDTWRSHKERIKAAKQLENLSKSSVAKDSMNLTIEAGLAITGLDMNMSYGGNQDIKSATRGFIKETVNEMLGQRGVGHTVERVIRIVNKVAQDRANYKQSMLNNFASIMKDPKRFDNHAKQSITRTVMMSDAQTLLHYHGMEQTLNYIANSKQRKVRIKELEDKLQSLSKNREHFNQLLKDTKDLAWYMVGETVSGDVKKNAELIATSAGTRSITPYEQMDQNIFEAVDELVTLHGLEMVNGKYMYTTQDLIQNEGQVLIAMLNTHHDLVKKSKEEFKDNPLNYIKGFKPAIHNPHVDVVAVKAEEVDDYIQKGYEQVLHGSIVQDELDNTEPRYLMINKNAPYARYNSGGLDMKDTHFRGYEVFNYKTNAKELARVGQGRLKRNTELAKTMDARSYDPRNIKGNHLIPRYGNDMLILGYNYEMSGELRDKLLDRDLSFDMMLATMGSELVAKPKLVETQRTLAQVLAEDAKNPITGFKISPVHFTVINPNSPDPRVQEMLRMMPYEFYQEMQHQFGKGKPFVIRTAVFNSVFGFRKYNVSEMFDKVSGERNYFEKFMVTLYENIYGKQARNKAANHQYVWEWFVTQAKDLIVIRSVKVLIGNIIANALISAAHGITPTELARGMFYAWKEGKAYRQLQAEEQRINFEMLNATSESQRKKLKAQLVAVRQNMQNSGMHEYMEEGLMSTIVEDIDMGSETKLFKSDFEKKLDNLAEKIPQPVRTTMKWATFHPDTEIHKFLSESTQFSDFAAKFVLAKHIERKSLKMGKSKKAAFKDGIQMAQEVFINYDTPTNRTLQAANDLGLFMFTKFTVRFQRALARQLHQNGGHAMLQHFMVEEYLPVAGLLNPFFPMFNTGLGAFTGIGALAQLPLIAMFL